MKKVKSKQKPKARSTSRGRTPLRPNKEVQVLQAKVQELQQSLESINEMYGMEIDANRRKYQELEAAEGRAQAAEAKLVSLQVEFRKEFDAYKAAVEKDLSNRADTILVQQREINDLKNAAVTMPTSTTAALVRSEVIPAESVVKEDLQGV